MTSGRVLVAMSGGVDSSVCARLLVDAGYECTGATMRLATNEDDRPGERTCCSTDDIADARQACWDAGIRHRVFDYSREFARDVIDPFVAAYEAGLTPNPCVACNRHLKFGALLDLALELGYDHVATGHYARVTHDDAGWHLLKGVDARKDQSYFLFGLTQERLAHVMFPLGGMLKDPDVRELAASYGLTSANKKDSEGICFVPGGNHLRFIEERTGRVAPEGDILDTEGNVLGRHQGALRYTLGQRKGLGVACAKPVYVCKVDTVANTVTLGDEDRLMASALVAACPPSPCTRRPRCAIASRISPAWRRRFQTAACVSSSTRRSARSRPDRPRCSTSTTKSSAAAPSNTWSSVCSRGRGGHRAPS